MPLLSATPSKPSRLTADDWVEAALAELIRGGVDAVQITVLARHLKVTRGSFYWHFDSRGALLDAVLKEWSTLNSGVMIEAVAEAETLDHGILALFSVWVDHTRFNPQLDQAVRDWARRSGDLKTTVRAEDDARVAAIAAFFERHGFEPTEAFIRARVIYFTQISYYALNVEAHEAMATRMTYLAAYFRAFTGRDIAPEIEAAYRAANLKGAGNEPAT